RSSESDNVKIKVRDEEAQASKCLMILGAWEYTLRESDEQEMGIPKSLPLM
ncbi:MAG: hypothetical protein M1839_001932, partial [Geoglossum umbratile]